VSVPEGLAELRGHGIADGASDRRDRHRGVREQPAGAAHPDGREGGAEAAVRHLREHALQLAARRPDALGDRVDVDVGPVVAENRAECVAENRLAALEGAVAHPRRGHDSGLMGVGCWDGPGGFEELVTRVTDLVPGRDDADDVARDCQSPRLAAPAA
jgi:hypothetical protein